MSLIWRRHPPFGQKCWISAGTRGRVRAGSIFSSTLHSCSPVPEPPGEARAAFEDKWRHAFCRGRLRGKSFSVDALGEELGHRVDSSHSNLLRSLAEVSITANDGQAT